MTTAGPLGLFETSAATGSNWQDNSIRGLGEAGLVLVGGSTFVHRSGTNLRMETMDTFEQITVFEWNIM